MRLFRTGNWRHGVANQAATSGRNNRTAVTARIDRLEAQLHTAAERLAASS